MTMPQLENETLVYHVEDVNALDIEALMDRLDHKLRPLSDARKRLFELHDIDALQQRVP